MSSVAEKRITPDEYLRIERVAETKSEYDDGVIFAMSGASERHNLLVAGIVRSVGNRLSSRCRVYPSDMRVRVVKPTRYFYPDVTVVCAESLFADDQRDVLLNPLVIFEVLSESTAAFDRGRKFLSYQAIESLQEYVLIWQDEYLLEYYRRDAGQWMYAVARGLDTTLPLSAAECEIPLRDIYYQVDLGPSE